MLSISKENTKERGFYLMMNYIWSGIFLASFSYAAFTGKLSAFGTAILESSQSAVTFMISLAGIMAMWTGLMEVAERTGLIRQLSKVLMPFTRLLFPKQEDPETLSCIIMSFMANIFGAGNSSTVFALRTMERLDAQNKHAASASNDMCTFAVVNMAFAPLVPIVTIQIREALGSEDPYSIVLPALITAGITVLISIVICKFMERRSSARES